MKSIVTIGFAFVLGFMAQTRGKFAILTIPSVAILYLIGSAWTFSTARILMPIGTPIFLVTPIAFLLAVVFRYRFARTLIMRLAPAPVARRMLASATDYRSEAKSNEASVVFFDLIGSTRIAEKVSPVDFSTLLNKYHETVSTNVENNHGLVVTFAGDGVMAAFTRSDAGADHAMHACNAALSVIRAMQSLNAETRQGGFPPLHLRIGVNSGSVAEGEIGATDRFNFSVVGDVVNLAAHLEQLGKTLFPTEQDIIIVGAATRQLASAEGLRFVDCGARSIPGHDRPESVFRLLPD